MLKKQGQLVGKLLQVTVIALAHAGPYALQCAVLKKQVQVVGMLQPTVTALVAPDWVRSFLHLRLCQAWHQRLCLSV